MLNVGKIEEGFVLDHIKAGKSLSIYKHLGLDKLDCTVAIIKNAKSGKMGKKDILKVECDINTLNLDILGFIDHNITVNVIKNSEIVQKRQLTLPREIKNVLKCKIHVALPLSSRNFPISSSLLMKKRKSAAANIVKGNTAVLIYRIKNADTRVQCSLISAFLFIAYSA